MDTTQIYAIVNDAVAQAIGQNALKVIDTSSLVSLGNTILTSNANTEAFLNALPQRIGKTIYVYRAYKNKMGDLVLEDFEYGAILQKISVGLLEAEPDASFELENGKSIDPWIVNKPIVSNKLFVTRTPYNYHVTIARDLLKEAFVNESGMERLIATIFGQMKNLIELGLEELGRACYANFIAETTNEVKLVTMFNNDSGSSFTPGQAIRDDKFLRFMLSEIKTYSKGYTDMTKAFNDGTATRFTPFEDQRLLIYAKLQTMLETTVQYAAFHDEYVRLMDYKETNFFQSQKTPQSISVKRASDQTDVTVENIVAVLHDRDALGIYKYDEDVLSTPVNARARYYNTFFHEKQLWFNDLSENFTLFTLN